MKSQQLIAEDPSFFSAKACAAVAAGALAPCRSRPLHLFFTMATKAWPKLARKASTYPPLYVSIARVIPTFFILGAGIELFMQKVPVGGRTFYDVALDKEVRGCDLMGGI